MAARDAAGQHRAAGGDHGADAGAIWAAVNKVAYAFMLICVAQGRRIYRSGYRRGDICVPPLGLGLATLIGRKNFSVEEREAGKTALVMGCVGVTEGAIPFAAARRCA